VKRLQRDTQKETNEDLDTNATANNETTPNETPREEDVHIRNDRQTPHHWNVRG
jgi:ATP-dependent Clp protease adapter protein ClpS